ncbi:unnamed protein product [Closterium sp. Naga37s-1]|nr:unnamed protein product [Closterium sp. Naga37s-1]
MRGSGVAAAVPANAYRFCCLCGTLLDMPSVGSVAQCALCATPQNLRDWPSLGVTTTSGPQDLMRRYGVDPIVPLDSDMGGGTRKESIKERAKVNEICPKCGNKEMEYYTMQLRSADEGQTVFYECTKCKYKYSLNT